jgi:hypothetical protein
MRSGNSAADGTDTATDQCSSQGIASGSAANRRACPRAQQSTGYRALPWAAPAAGQGKSKNHNRNTEFFRHYVTSIA